MLTLEQAIKHALEKSTDKNTCRECQKEHAQLAKWLEELQILRRRYEALKQDYPD